MIGVTGTKGKGTTSTLIARILEAGGLRVWLGGNIGQAPLDFLHDVSPTDVVVLELSSFQLMDADQSPGVGVVLMIVPEHLDYHRDMHEYVEAKGNLVRYQGAQDIVIYNAQNEYARQLAGYSPGSHIPYGDRTGAYLDEGRVMFRDRVICRVDEVRLIGAHNLENVCAAVAATVGRVEDAAIARAIREFSGLEHRLEYAGEYRGVKFYNDSFSTAPATAIAAIRAFSEPKILILGGSDKKSRYDELAEVIAHGDVRRAILIGDTAPQILQALEAVGFGDVETGHTKMADIVGAAVRAARPGDIVLLSPACASFGLFENYKDRGSQFKAVVRSLQG